MMSRGDLSLNEIAREIGLGTDELKQRLDMLEHMGYILSEDSMAMGAGGGCSSCPSAGTCGAVSGSLGIKIATYQLTDKGRKVMAK